MTSLGQMFEALFATGLLERCGGLLLMFVLHATVLLAAVWLAERLGALKHPGWAEFAWRTALFGAFFSVAIEAVPLLRSSMDGQGGAPVPTVATARDAQARILPTASTTDGVSTTPPTPSGMASADSRSADTTPEQTTAAPGVSASNNIAPNEIAPNKIRSNDSGRIGVIPGRATTLALPMAGDAMLAALLLWIIGCAVLALRVLGQARALVGLRRRLLREGAPTSMTLRREADALAREMRMPMPELRILPAIAGPMVMPGVVLLPPWADRLDASRQRAMLAHEFAHLRRRDPFWRPLQRLALVPLFFHPLAWHALRRLEALAEYLCDRAAAERGDGRALAECLAECLARSAGDPHGPRGAGWALAMAERGDGIVARVRSLLENAPMTLPTMSPRRRWIAIAVVLTALIALPGVMVVRKPGLVDRLFNDADLSVTIREDSGTSVVQSDMPPGEGQLRVAMDDDVVFKDDESDVLKMRRDAKFELRQARAGVEREIVISAAPDGTLQRIYRVDGKVRAYDAEARAWLASVIPEMHRLTGHAAGARTKRLLARGGVPLVLKEIGLIRHDFARAEYIAALLTQATLDDEQMTSVLATIRAMASDHETRRALTAVIKSRAPSVPLQRLLLEAAAGIESDYERAEWTVAAVRRLPVSDGNLPAWQALFKRYGSAYVRKRALQAMIGQGQPRAAALVLAMQAMQGMESDFERRSVLETAVTSGAPLPDAHYLAVVDMLNSDFEKREALHALIRSGAPDVERSRGVLRSARRISSDFEAGEVLQALAEVMPGDKALIEDYRAVTRAMGSDFERGEAEKALDRFYRG